MDCAHSNKNLLSQSLAIFAHSFMGCSKNGCLGDYCTVKSGYAFKSSWWTKYGIKVVKIGSINQDSLNLNACSYISSEKLELAKDFLVQGGDLLIAMTGATIGKFAMVPSVDEPILVNQRVGKFLLGEDPIKRLPFIYCQLKQPDIYNRIITRGGGSAQANISSTEIMTIPCVMPDKESITSFNKLTSPFFETIIRNQRENQYLTSLRDTLLPKLMCNELDITELNV